MRNITSQCTVFLYFRNDTQLSCWRLLFSAQNSMMADAKLKCSKGCELRSTLRVVGSEMLLESCEVLFCPCS